MKKATKIAGISLTVIIIIVYLITCFTPYISPADFSLITLFSLAYLPVLFIYFLLILAWLFINRKIALLLFVMLFAGTNNLRSTFGFHVLAPAWSWKKDTTALRIMTWNVNYLGNPFISADTPGNVRRDILNWIAEVEPDVLCLQDFSSIEEGTAKNVFLKNTDAVSGKGKFLSHYFPFTYEYNGRNYSDRYGVIFFSRYPITDSGSFEIGTPQRIEHAGFADVQFRNHTVRIFGAHLSSMALWPNKNGEAGLNYLEGDSTRKKTLTLISKLRYFEKIHAQEAEIIKQEMNKSPHPVILAADLNTVPSSYVYHRLRKDLHDAFLEKDFGIGGTYHLVFPKIRIDVLLHSKEIEVVQYTRPAVNFSDHYPVMADIRWKK